MCVCVASYQPAVHDLVASILKTAETASHYSYVRNYVLKKKHTLMWTSTATHPSQRQEERSLLTCESHEKAWH